MSRVFRRSARRSWTRTSSSSASTSSSKNAQHLYNAVNLKKINIFSTIRQNLIYFTKFQYFIILQFSTIIPPISSSEWRLRSHFTNFTHSRVSTVFIRTKLGVSNEKYEHERRSFPLVSLHYSAFCILSLSASTLRSRIRVLKSAQIMKICDFTRPPFDDASLSNYSTLNIPVIR